MKTGWFYRQTEGYSGTQKPEFECFPVEHQFGDDWIGPYPNEEAALRNYWADNYTEIGEDVTDLVFVIVSPEVSEVMFPDPEEIENVCDWGKEHWSLLIYVETCVVDNKGILNSKHLRLKGGGHWRQEYATRLNNGVQIPDHDDNDCLLDLEREGFITSNNQQYALTEKGWYTVGQLRRHKAEGKRIVEFQYS